MWGADASRYRPPVRKTMGIRAAMPRMLAAAVCFAVMGALVKASVAALPFLVAVLFRSMIGFLVLGSYFAVTRTPLVAKQHWLLFLRSAFGFTALILYFFALEELPLSTAVVLNFSSPVFVVILSGVFLAEHMAVKMLPLVLLAFGGAALLIAPDLSKVNLAAVLALASALFAAVAYIIVGRVSKTESSATIVYYFSMYSTVFSVVILGVAVALGYSDLSLARIGSVLADPLQLVFLCGVGVSGTIAQLFLTAAYARERASVVSGFSYLTPIFSYVIGLCLFDEVPTMSSILGGAIIIVASIAILIVSRPRAMPLMNPS